MEKEVNEFVNAGGEPIGSKIPITDPKVSAKTTTDKSVRMRAQPFMYTVYRRFFSESELPHTAKADEMKDNPKGFHQYLETMGEGDKFESYFQKDDSAQAKLKEISRIKAYDMMEALLSNKGNNQDIMTKTPPTIEEIKNKEILLVDKLTKLAEAIKNLMSEEEKKVLLSYFAKQIK